MLRYPRAVAVHISAHPRPGFFLLRLSRDKARSANEKCDDGARTGGEGDGLTVEAYRIAGRLVETGMSGFLDRERKTPFTGDRLVSEIHAAKHKPASIFALLDRRASEARPHELRANDVLGDSKRRTQRRAGDWHEEVVGRALDRVDGVRVPRAVKHQRQIRRE